MEKNSKITKYINQFGTLQSDPELGMLELDEQHELMMMELDRQHELKMLEMEKGWLGRFFEKIFGR